MDRQDLDRLAYAGTELPAGLGYSDTLYFLMLRALYAYAKQTDIPPEQGRREKMKIEDAVRKYRADERAAMTRALQFRDTDAALSAYRKAREKFPGEFEPSDPDPVAASIRAADRIAEALDNISIERVGNAKPNHQGVHP